MASHGCLALCSQVARCCLPDHFVAGRKYRGEDKSGPESKYFQEPSLSNPVAPARAHMHAPTYTVHAYTHAYTCTCTCMHTHKHMHTHTHACTHSHINTSTHAHMCACQHTCKHTNFAHIHITHMHKHAHGRGGYSDESYKTQTDISTILLFHFFPKIFLVISSI